MRKSFISFMCLVAHVLAFSQGYEKKDIIVSASVGMPHLFRITEQLYTRTSAFKKGFKGQVEVISVKGTNPIALKYEYAIGNHFGLGLSVAWWSVIVDANDRYDQSSGTITNHITDNYNVKYRSTSLGIRPNYHFPVKWKKADLYMGCAIGLTKNEISINFSSTGGYGYTPNQFYDGSAPFSIYIAPTVGCHLFISGNMGLNFEVGFEKGALLQAGVVFRFRPMKYEPYKK